MIYSQCENCFGKMNDYFDGMANDLDHCLFNRRAEFLAQLQRIVAQLHKKGG